MTTPETKIPAPSELHAKWRKIVEKELQGAPFEKKLVTGLVEGLKVQPLYGPEAQPTDLSGAVRRGLRRQNPGAWAVAQEVEASTPEELNALWRKALARAQNSLAVSGCASLSSQALWLKALDQVTVEAIPLYVRTRVHVAPMAAVLVAALRARGTAGTSVTGSIGGDPLAAWLEKGSLPTTLAQLWDERAEWTQWAKTNLPQVATLEVDASTVAEAGGHAVQELIYALGAASETLAAMAARGVPVADAVARVRTVFSSGPDFFLEVAKLRAWRELWALLTQAFGVEGVPSRVHAATSRWNKSQLDLETNLLRTTTEALAAVVSGVESLEIARYDELAPKDGEVATRLARNLHTLLSEEFQVSSPLDPVGGSWYVEELTSDLAKRAWAGFQALEGEGGLVAALQKGSWQKQVSATANERADAADKRRTIWVGVNQYPNAKDKLEISAVAATNQPTRIPTLSTGPRLTRFVETLQAAENGASIAELALRWRVEGAAEAAIDRLSAFRVASGFEQLRARVTALTVQGRRPKVFLAKIGPAAQHKARADFSAGFFTAGGFELVGKEAYGTAAAAAEAARASGAPFCVLCSTDDTYPTLVPEFATALRQGGSGPKFLLAGYPADQVEAFRAAGVDEFIHLRANVRTTLEGLLNSVSK